MESSINGAFSVDLRFSENVLSPHRSGAQYSRPPAMRGLPRFSPKIWAAKCYEMVCPLPCTFPPSLSSLSLVVCCPRSPTCREELPAAAIRSLAAEQTIDTLDTQCHLCGASMQRGALELHVMNCSVLTIGSKLKLQGLIVC